MTTPALKRTLRPVHLAAIGMGTTIGIGWIVLTGRWIADAGPGGAALAFAIGGSLMLLVALCYADMATRLPSASGEFEYVSAVFGQGWGFAVGWFLLLGYVGICCFEGLALAWLLSVLAPGHMGPVLYSSLGSPVRVLDVVVVVGGATFFSALNIMGARESAAFQVAVTVGKVLLSLVFILIGITGGDIAHWTPVFEPANAPWAGIASVMVMVPAWFCGFNALPQALGEAESRPTASALSRLLASVIVLTTLFYVVVIIATATAAPRAVLLGSELPVVAAIEVVAGPVGGQVVLVTGIVALLSAWNAAMFAASRLLSTLGRGGALPGVLSRVEPGTGTPSAAVLFVGVVALAGGLMGRAFIAPLVQIGAIGFSVAFIATCLSTLHLDIRAPGPSRGIPLRTAAAVGAAALGGVVAMSLHAIFSGREGWPPEATALAAWLGLGLILRRLATRPGSGPCGASE